MGGYPEWIRFAGQRLPWEEDPNPCDECELCGGKNKAPEKEGFECDPEEGETNHDECPIWNPEPVYCAMGCGRVVGPKDDFCPACKKIEREAEEQAEREAIEKGDLPDWMKPWDHEALVNFHGKPEDKEECGSADKTDPEVIE